MHGTVSNKTMSSVFDLLAGKKDRNPGNGHAEERRVQHLKNDCGGSKRANHPIGTGEEKGNQLIGAMVYVRKTQLKGGTQIRNIFREDGEGKREVVGKEGRKHSGDDGEMHRPAARQGRKTVPLTRMRGQRRAAKSNGRRAKPKRG